mmetsp:Transcript_19979/g.60684  ORF Transcript_19979/g.60684 Transcript_19979/m.60684 type:complete len:91 (+) Transcript_19979:795-1067(+)
MKGSSLRASQRVCDPWWRDMGGTLASHDTRTIIAIKARVRIAMDACSLPFYTYKKIGAQGTADAIESFVLSLISVLRMTQGVVGLRACIA